MQPEVMMAALTRDDVVGLLKPAEVIVVVQILATGATKEEFAEAYAWRGSDQCWPEPPVRTGWPDRHDLASNRGRCTRGCISRVVQGSTHVQAAHLATCIVRPGIPALFVFKHGQVAARHVGIMDVSSRRPWIESSLRRWIEQTTT